MRIALAGNPNSGKTTMYNALTGRNEKVGNWAGVTVEKKESLIKSMYSDAIEELTAVDLPGAYSMSPYTSEESITSAYVKNENPDVIINIVDATNLSRSLFFTTQLLELGIPVVVALNKSDINRKRGTLIDIKLLSQKLGCPVIETVSTSKNHEGLIEIVEMAVSLKESVQSAPYIQDDFDLHNKKQVEIADRKRFDFVNEMVKMVEKRKGSVAEKNIQDNIDKLLTSPYIGIPVFALVMFLVFYISQSTVGTWLADWLTGWIDVFREWVLERIGDANPFLQSLLADGIIGGVGAVVGFLPLVMIMQSFNWNMQVVDEGMENTSILAGIASPIAFVLIPIVGVGAWQLAAASVTGFIAKENVVGTLAVCYGLSAFIDTEELTLVGDGNVVASTIALSKVGALAYLMFNLYTPPCFAALGAMNSEMQSKKWLWGGIALQIGTGYTIAFLVYQIGTFATTGMLGRGFMPGLIAIILMSIVILLLIIRTNRRFKGDYELKKAV